MYCTENESQQFCFAAVITFLYTITVNSKEKVVQDPDKTKQQSH